MSGINVSNALFIGTNDHHFDVVSMMLFPSVNPIDIDSFLAMLKEDVSPIN